MSTMNQLGKYQPYPDYKDSGVEWLGVIPPEWQKMPLKRHCKVVSGYAFPSEMFIDSGLPVIRIGDIKSDGSVVLDDCKYIQKESGYLYSRFTIASGELLMAMTGATIGKAGWFKSDTKAFLNQRVGVFRVSGGFEYKFLWYVLNSSGYQEYIQLTAFGGAQPNISDTGMLAYEAAFPTINEQRTIATFLDYETARIDQLIAKQQQLIELLKEKRQAVISHAVTKGLNPNVPMKDSGVEWLGQVPEHWQCVPFGLLVSRADLGGNYLGGVAEEGIPFLKMGNLGRGCIVLDKLEFLDGDAVYDVSHRLEMGDFLFNTRNSLDLVGKVAVWHGELDCAIYNSNILRVRFKSNFVANSDFMGAVFNSSGSLGWLSLLAKGTTSVAAIYYKDLRSMMIPIPPHDEQETILSFITNAIDKLDSLEQKAIQSINFMNERRTALISAAVTGKIDLRGWQPPKREVAA